MFMTYELYLSVHTNTSFLYNMYVYRLGTLPMYLTFIESIDVKYCIYLKPVNAMN